MLFCPWPHGCLGSVVPCHYPKIERESETKRAEGRERKDCILCLSLGEKIELQNLKYVLLYCFAPLWSWEILTWGPCVHVSGESTFKKLTISILGEYAKLENFSYAFRMQNTLTTWEVRQFSCEVNLTPNSPAPKDLPTESKMYIYTRSVGKGL